MCGTGRKRDTKAVPQMLGTSHGKDNNNNDDDDDGDGDGDGV